MSQLQLSLLGEPAVQHGEHTLTFPTRKALALLVYLAVEGGPHPRKTLSEAFWPELDAEHGRAALRATLMELRKLLERSHGADEVHHLLVERDTLGLDLSSPLSLDLHLVEASSKLVERGIERLTCQAQDAILAQLEHATRQVRGPFLDGFTLRDSQCFDDWSRQQREYWHLRVHQLFDALSLLYERAGDGGRALETVTGWLRFDPLNEEGYRRLMRLRYAQGDRVGALRAYATGRELLAKHLHVEPEPETVALAKRMRHAPPVRAPQGNGYQPPQTSLGQPAANLLDGPFLGRTGAFGTLIECYQRMRAGHAQLVVLQGESGIGKTRLANEFVCWAQAQGADVAMGRAFQTSRQLPYQPLIEVLRSHLQQEDAPTNLLGDVWFAELSRVLPELRERYPNLPAPSSDETLGHTCLFEATARLVQAWASRRPLVLVLDDIQWADAATLDLLCYLARSLVDQSAQVLLLFTLCSNGDSCTQAQSPWCMTLKRACMPLVVLELAALTHEETQRFVQGLAWAEQPLQLEDTSVGERGSQNSVAPLSRDALVPFANWLYIQTRGQPLYLVETLKELHARALLAPSLQENGTWGLVLRTELLAQTPVGELIPSSVRELIRSQIDRLTPSARALVVAGAALGQALTFEHLMRVAQLDEHEGLEALEELVRAGLLCEATPVAAAQAFDGYAFPCEMIREVVFQEAGLARKKLMQQRALRVMREEEARLLHATSGSRHAAAQTRTEQGRLGAAGSTGETAPWTATVPTSGATGGPAHPAAGALSFLAVRTRGAADHRAPAFPRSHPGQASRAF